LYLRKKSPPQLNAAVASDKEKELEPLLPIVTMYSERRRGSQDQASISDIEEENETEDTENIPMNDCERNCTSTLIHRPLCIETYACLFFTVLPPPIVVTDNGGMCTKVVKEVPNTNNLSARRRPRPNHLHIDINCTSSDLSSHESLPSHKVGQYLTSSDSKIITLCGFLEKKKFST
jgi:hypothetical protein